jgi:hypothetical protein
MAKWTSEELSALKRTHSYQQFFRATGGTKTFDAWEVKRRRVQPEPDEMSEWEIHRAVQNNIKLARQVIRTRHSIEADDELADVIPRITAILTEQAQSGRVNGLSYDELRSLIYGA